MATGTDERLADLERRIEELEAQLEQLRLAGLTERERAALDAAKRRGTRALLDEMERRS